MTCANCGTPQNDNEEICLACGAKYPEINNENKPTSKNKSKEVGNSSALFSIFDSKNDAMNITEHEENIFFDVLKNKKPKKEQKEKDNKEIKSNESKAKAPKEAKAVKKEKVQKVKDVKETVKSDIVQTQNSEIEEAQVVNNEPVQAIAQDENQVNVQVQIEAPIIDSFLPETVIDTENNVFKDSDDFNISLSDLDELEKSITKAKEENQ